MYRETVLLDEGFRLELVLQDHKHWSLAFINGGKRLVEYSSRTPYPFKSVEKLRYDFERDCRDSRAQDTRHPR